MLQRIRRIPGFVLSVVVVVSIVRAGIPGTAHAQTAAPTGFTLTWITPSPSSNDTPIAAYELRVSAQAPGANIEAWWASATPQTGVPAPGAPGSREVWRSPTVPEHDRVYAAVRSVDLFGTLSPLSGVTTWTRPDDPFLVALEPGAIPGCGAQSFVIHLAGSSEVTAVRLVDPADGTTIVADRIGIVPQGIRVHVTLHDISSTVLDVEVDGPGGTDRRARWLRIDDPNARTAAQNAAVSPISFSAEGGAWLLKVYDTHAAPSAPGGCDEETNDVYDVAAESAPLDAPRVQIFDVTGRLLARLETQRTGDHWESRWSGSGDNGSRVPNGIFFLRVLHGETIQRQKILLRWQ